MRGSFDKPSDEHGEKHGCESGVAVSIGLGQGVSGGFERGISTGRDAYQSGGLTEPHGGADQRQDPGIRIFEDIFGCHHTMFFPPQKWMRVK